MTNPIVTVNVSQVIAPTPSKLQKTGALISQGATDLDVGTYQLLTQPDDLTDILVQAQALSGISWSGGVVTATAAAPYTLEVGKVIRITLTGNVPAGYNGTYDCTIVSDTSFTYVLAGDPGANTTLGSYIPEDVSELVAMVDTFFAQGRGQAVYVLELGGTDVSGGVANLSTFITSSPQFFYRYLVPRTWDNNSDFIALAAQFQSPTAKTYFHVTTTVDTYTAYSALFKCIMTYIEAPNTPVTEFFAASDFYWLLNLDPSTTNKVPPHAFTFLFDVTPYPTTGNAALLTTLKNAGVNIAGTGAEGGISDVILLWGTTMDLRDASYWYSVDWVQINVDLAVSNAVINGSNNPVNPLYYNQDGINRLQAVAAGVMASGVTFGLVLGGVIQTELDGPVFDANLDAGVYAGQTVVNAVPFIPYSKENPGDYKIGKYAGFAIVYTPSRGFIQIIFNVVVTDFVTA